MQIKRRLEQSIVAMEGVFKRWVLAELQYMEVKIFTLPR